MSDLTTNIARADGYLARFRSEGVLNHIGGKAVPAQDCATFEIISPVDLQPLAQVAHGKAADVAQAVAAAKAAFPVWRAMEGETRKALLHRIADAIEARAEEIAFVEAMDTGQSIRFMAKAALRGAENFRYFADLAPKARDGQTLRAKGQVNMTTRTPIGPVGIITPWNT
ncbi:MAG: aldehyde dehydrogenase family protein, partial [Cypionkella sp.]|nr:aldehyde dehydrogenase family protein [Cypionkella sp.]